MEIKSTSKTYGSKDYNIIYAKMMSYIKSNPLFIIIFIFFSVRCFSQTSDGLPIKLKVATYNVGHFNQGSLGGFQGQKKQATAEINNWKNWISKQEIDILSINEWNKFFDKDSLHHAERMILTPFYQNTYFGSLNTWIYNGIACNLNLTNIRELKLDGQYYAILGDLKIGKKVITIVSVHIPWQKGVHDSSLDRLILELKKYEYFICMGDINASDENQLKFTKSGFNMANGGQQGWFATAAPALINSGRTGGTNMNIDNIITSPNIKIFNISAPKTGLNDLDHFPIIADLVIP